ncbi:hypothetical protein RHMOL_Rhmol01G0343300 [Rhododendron molle]|uniref:Uncharacterized protein n=1 Tax=Rhododendron molle TaxID=49168 RepID=A0ACC0Q8E8_RHOML|nr:hypothetical protein RHMOL_Rhmol01G0343300 [Rhododendron molle]
MSSRVNDTPQKKLRLGFNLGKKNLPHRWPRQAIRIHAAQTQKQKLLHLPLLKLPL